MKQQPPKREYSSSPPSTQLEPRVAKLELGMERLTDDVRDLAQVVRNQGSQMEQQIQQLVVAVTQAAGPRKTDWSTIIAAVMLIMAIGSAAFWPLNQTVQEQKQRLESYHTSMVDHQKLDNHPVGAALVQRLEEQLKIHAEYNKKEMAEHVEQARLDHETMRKHYHEELDLQAKFFDAQLKAEHDRNQLYMDKLYGRVVALEEGEKKEAESERSELLQWRQKAMGLSSPNASVPLVPRDMAPTK